MSKQDKTIQEKTDELDAIVAWFDSEDFTLESALDKFKQAEALAQDIQKDLIGLKNEINVIKQRFDVEACVALQ